MAIFVFCLTQAEGLITGTMVKMFTIALSGDRLRHRGERGVRFGAGAAGVRGIDFGGGQMAASEGFEEDMRR